MSTARKETLPGSNLSIDRSFLEAFSKRNWTPPHKPLDAKKPHLTIKFISSHVQKRDIDAAVKEFNNHRTNLSILELIEFKKEDVEKIESLITQTPLTRLDLIGLDVKAVAAILPFLKSGRGNLRLSIGSMRESAAKELFLAGRSLTRVSQVWIKSNNDAEVYTLLKDREVIKNLKHIHLLFEKGNRFAEEINRILNEQGIKSEIAEKRRPAEKNAASRNSDRSSHHSEYEQRQSSHHATTSHHRSRESNYTSQDSAHSHSSSQSQWRSYNVHVEYVPSADTRNTHSYSNHVPYGPSPGMRVPVPELLPTTQPISSANSLMPPPILNASSVPPFMSMPVPIMPTGYPIAGYYFSPTTHSTNSNGLMSAMTQQLPTLPVFSATSLSGNPAEHRPQELRNKIASNTTQYHSSTLFQPSDPEGRRYQKESLLLNEDGYGSIKTDRRERSTPY